MPPSVPPAASYGNGHAHYGNGHVVDSGHGNGSANGHYGEPSRLPQVAAPPTRPGTLPPVSAPVVRRAPPPPLSRDPLADSITRVNAQPQDTQRDDPYGLAVTGPSVAAEPLDWEDEEESTHVFQSSAPPPPPSPRRSLPRIAAPPVPRSLAGGRSSQPSEPYARPSTARGLGDPARLDQAPGLDTVRLETRSALDQPRADIVAERTPSYHGPIGSLPGSAAPPFFPPSPPIPSVGGGSSSSSRFPASPPIPTLSTKAGHSEPPPANGVVAGAEEVVRDQPFVRLPQGNPFTATELAVKKPVLPAHLAEPLHAPPPSAKKWLIAAAVAAVLSVFALVAFVFSRRPGGLEIDVRDAANASVPKAEVFIDGRKVCDATPCTLKDLDVGRYSVRVLVPTDSTLEPQTADVQAGLTARLVFKLAPALGTLVVGTEAPGLHVFVDGVDRGMSPVKLTDLAPGKHDIKLAGDRYKPFQQSVDVKAGETLDLGAPKLSVVKGRAVVSVKTEGVSIVLVRNDDTAHPKALEGPFPRPIEVETASGSWKLIAKKKGLPDFVAPIDFSDGVAEKTIVVDLSEKKEEPAKTEPVATADSKSPAPTPAQTPTRTEPVAKNDPPPKSDPPKQETKSEGGT
ncbi:MAG TPA: PEGA domain-containing protein, partial [Polyangiaceae bacterium]|nr:PEGA domain-containing protein [Polyangiaceae bacterium]